MARPLRIEFPGAIYHITSRGDDREAIYLSDEDREIFLNVLAQVVDRFGWRCHAWCLMTNHYHLMIETPKANLSRGMRHLNGVYTQRFNRLHNRTGHVFQGRYKAILVERDAHLLQLCRYIVRNPLAANMVAEVSEWTWSSYRVTAGLKQPPSFTCINWILEQFGGSRERYRKYVEQASNEEPPLLPATGSHVLGSSEFRKQVQQKINAGSEVPRAEKHIIRSSLDKISTCSLERGEWMTSAFKDHGYTMREIANYAEVHYSLVSKNIKAWETR